MIADDAERLRDHFARRRQHLQRCRHPARLHHRRRGGASAGSRRARRRSRRDRSPAARGGRNRRDRIDDRRLVLLREPQEPVEAVGHVPRAMDSSRARRPRAARRRASRGRRWGRRRSRWRAPERRRRGNRSWERSWCELRTHPARHCPSFINAGRPSAHAPPPNHSHTGRARLAAARRAGRPDPDDGAPCADTRSAPATLSFPLSHQAQRAADRSIPGKGDMSAPNAARAEF